MPRYSSPYADAPPEGCESLLIARDFLSPVATKDVASTLRTPADLLGASLIHNGRPTGWADWLRSVRRRAERHLARHQFQRQRPRACGRRVQPGRGAGQPVFGGSGARFGEPRAAIRPRVWCGAWMIRYFHARSASGIPADAVHLTCSTSGAGAWSVEGTGVQSCPLHSSTWSSAGGKQFCPSQ